jgi:hypothetical protein
MGVQWLCGDKRIKKYSCAVDTAAWGLGLQEKARGLCLETQLAGPSSILKYIDPHTPRSPPSSVTLTEAWSFHWGLGSRPLELVAFEL